MSIKNIISNYYRRKKMTFTVNAREGNSYQTIDGNVITISDTASKISTLETQTEALKHLGVSLDNKTLKINFSETGNPYSDPHGDRTKIGEKITETITVELLLENSPPSTLKIQASLIPFNEDGINFAGQVNFETPKGEKRRIPLTGRGTAALEGRANDAHAGVCTGGACAAFQERTALVLSVAAAAGATHEQIQSIGEKLRSLNDKFHGRGDILSYTIKAAQTSQDELETYIEFMKARYPEGNRSSLPLLESIINTGKPNKSFYQKALTKMSREEREEDRKSSNK